MSEDSALLPAEELALTIARAQVERGEAPGVNTASVLVFALQRLDALLNVTPMHGVSTAKNLIHMLSAEYIDASKPVYVTGYDSAGEFGVFEVIGTTSTARMRQALLWIGPECQNYTSGIGSCWEHREPDARYGADRWCDGCIAAYGLGRGGAS